MKELKITKDRIKRLVRGLDGCHDAQQAVKDAFPEAFEEKEWGDITGATYWKISGVSGQYWLLGYYGMPHPTHGAQFILDGDGIRLNHRDFLAEYRIEQIKNNFRILKKS